MPIAPLPRAMLFRHLQKDKNTKLKFKVRVSTCVLHYAFFFWLGVSAFFLWRDEESSTSSAHLPAPTAPRIYQQKGFIVHSISHTDSLEDIFPRQAIEASESEPYIAETHYNNGTTPAEYIFWGRGRPYYPPGVNTSNEKNLRWPTVNATVARCTHRTEGSGLCHETAHYFQQLIRCFSWWQMPINKGKQPVLHIQRCKGIGTTQSSEFIQSYYKAMSDVFNITLEIEEYNQLGNMRNTEIYVETPWQVNMSTSTQAYGMDTQDSLHLPEYNY
jgi:hypothetical protein